eukprot:COSAG05_NODE_5330_length_1205_cov_99.330521_1_plen_58_part_01
MHEIMKLNRIKSDCRIHWECDIMHLQNCARMHLVLFSPCSAHAVDRVQLTSKLNIGHE